MRLDPRLAAVPVVALVVAVTWVAAVVAPTPHGSAASLSSVIAVRQANLVCPQAGGAGTGPAAGGALASGASSAGAARIAYADAGATDSGDSHLTTQPLAAGASAVPVVAQPDHGWVIDGPAALTPMQVSVSGSLTDTLSAVQFTRAMVGTVPQASAVQCDGPTTDAWFAGFSSNVGAHATLLLSNVDTVQASVNVSIWGGEGGEPTVRQGIVVAAQTQVVVALDQIDPGLPVAAVHVTAIAGRIVPALRADAENGSIPLGVDWLPRISAPATTQTVPGILGDGGSRQLIVGNPGTLDATYSLTAVTSDGAYVPTEFTSLTVVAGAVSQISLDPVLQGSAAAIVVTSTQPVVVGGISSTPPDGTGASDYAFTGAASPLSGPTVVAGGEISAQRDTELVMSVPGAVDATVRVVVLPTQADSPPVVNDMTVPGGTTTVLDVASLTTDPAPGVVVIPEGGGPLYAAWSLSEVVQDSSDLTELVLQTPTRTLLRPPVHLDPAAGLH
jgi:Family of unknown function (DUF5719)